MNILPNSATLKQSGKENFPVASLLIPRHLRQAILTLYVFARSMDNIADSSTLSAAQKYAALADYQQQLDLIAQHGTPKNDLFQSLAHVVKTHQLPLTPLYQLLDKLRSDVAFQQPADFHALLQYCEGSANTIGVIFLHLFNACTPALKQQSDAVCTALQLIDCWQDIRPDYEQGRLYMPNADMAQYGLSAQDIRDSHFTAGWQQCMQHQLQRTHDLLKQGSDLPLALSGRLGWEMRVMVLGGFYLLHKIEQVKGDIFHHQPRMTKWDWIKVLGQSFRYKSVIRQEKNRIIDCSCATAHIA